MKTSWPVYDKGELTGINRNIYFEQQCLAHSSPVPLISHWLLAKSYIYERCSIQLEQPEYSKDNPEYTR